MEDQKTIYQSADLKKELGSECAVETISALGIQGKETLARCPFYPVAGGWDCQPGIHPQLWWWDMRQEATRSLAFGILSSFWVCWGLSSLSGEGGRWIFWDLQVEYYWYFCFSEELVGWGKVTFYPDCLKWQEAPGSTDQISFRWDFRVTPFIQRTGVSLPGDTVSLENTKHWLFFLNGRIKLGQIWDGGSKEKPRWTQLSHGLRLSTHAPFLAEVDKQSPNLWVRREAVGAVGVGHKCSLSTGEEIFFKN